jgi:hypothetical protein
MTDDELKSILQTWEAPPAPATLRTRVFRGRRNWVQWLLSGELRVPVPVALGALCVLLFLAYRVIPRPTSSLSDFQPVDQFKPRIVRIVHETR